MGRGMDSPNGFEKRQYKLRALSLSSDPSNKQPDPSSEQPLEPVRGWFGHPNAVVSPRLQVALALGWLVLIVAFSATPIYKAVCKPDAGTNKDYDIWYQTGLTVAAGGELYPRDPLRYAEFLYPPAAGAILAPLSMLGRSTCVTLLVLANVVSWIAAQYLALHLIGALRSPRRAAVCIVPFVCTGWYVSDNFLLGQPNVFLLAILLSAFVALRHGWQTAAGMAIGLATAIKAFPIMAICYLVYRKQWVATAAMLITTIGLTLLAPMPFRGVARSLDDADAWLHGMVFRYDEEGIAMRPQKSYEWKNQSLIATCNRLLRPVVVDVYDEKLPDGSSRRQAVTANVLSLPFRTIHLIILAAAASFCLAFVAVMPGKTAVDRNTETDNIEQSMLLVMMTVMSPISWFYYGVWLLFPHMVIWNEIDRPGTPVVPRGRLLVGWLVSLGLLNFLYGHHGLRQLRAVGWPFFGYTGIFLLLGWLMIAKRRQLWAAAERATNEHAVAQATVAYAAGALTHESVKLVPSDHRRNAA